MILDLGELGCHCRIAPSELLERHILRLVVRKTKIPIGAEQGFLRLLQVVDRLVDLLDRRLEAPGGEVVVLRECSLERLKLGFKVRDVDILRLPSACSDLYLSEFIAALRNSVIIGMKNCGRTIYIFG